MFQSLRENRSLVMGLSILWVAFYHIPWVDCVPLFDFIHDIGYIGVDVFLFLSGVGLCHSVRSRGREGYLVQRARRILPGLFPVLLIWSLFMLCTGIMNLLEFFGSVSLLGWWLGQSKQLNWYFSAVWMFYLLGAMLYRPVIQGKHPVPVVLLVVFLSFLAQQLSPYHYHSEAFARVPVFLIGMLLGRAELSGKVSEKKLRLGLYGPIPVGLVLVVMTYRFWGQDWGLSLGLWWYPFMLVVPGAVFLTAELAALLKKWKLGLLLRPMESLGAASSEALMLHVGIYKMISNNTSLYRGQWMLVMVFCMILGVAYRRFVVKKLPFYA